MSDTQGLKKAASEIVPVLDAAIEFMEEALLAKQADDQRIQELTTSLKKAKAEQERIVLEKVAEARKGIINEGVVKEALARLQSMGILDQSNSVKLASRFIDEPNSVFPMMVKLAEKLLSAPGDGAGIEKEAAASESDPDGWGAYAEGRPVKVVR